MKSEKNILRYNCCIEFSLYAFIARLRARRVRVAGVTRAFFFTSLLVLISLLASCASKAQQRVITPKIGAREKGIASWYGDPYHGRKTASGEIYDMHRRDTAAHKRFAFGTWVRVENLDNGQRTEVRINDRGPFVRRRIIDLSRGAANEIGMLGPGTARVKLVVIPPPKRAAESPPPPEESTTPPPPLDGWAVQVAAFREEPLARTLAARLNAQVIPPPPGETWWRVILSGPARSEPEARENLHHIRMEFPQAFLVRF